MSPSEHAGVRLDLDRILAEIDREPSLSDGGRAIALARVLLERARQLQTPHERRQQAELDRMISLPDDKATLVQLTDQAFRTSTPQRVADQLTHILDVQGVPRFFSPLDRTLLRGFQSFGEYLPGVAVPLVKDKMRRETANVILPAEPEMLREHLKQRRQEGVRMNLNLLGEAVLGEEEAYRRLQEYLAALQIPEVECVSVKISTIYSQISPVAREHTLEIICDRLERLYRAAARARFVRADQTIVSKFVYLDMEEYRDMSLTAEALRRTLSRPGMEQVRAGIALQAYIPDSYLVLRELADWARARVARGLAPLTIRVVKGANMEMERVDASLHGWPQAPYSSKRSTDANFKRMIREVLLPENRKALRLGVASHNLFDIALAILWARDSGTLDQVQFEMLEGMANHQRRAIFEVSRNLLLYAPACQRSDFLNAIGYLIRRLDENTGEENFLRYAFRLCPDSPEWARLSSDFLEAMREIESVPARPRRNQDQRQSPKQPPAAMTWRAYENEPDTDWALPHHSLWADEILSKWKQRSGNAATFVPLTVAGKPVDGSREIIESTDPSRPGTVVCRYALAQPEDLDRAVRCAADDPSGWRSLEPNARYEILRRVAQQIREQRGDLLGAAAADGGKTLLEGDPEVSEAVDFVEFYALAARELFERPGLRAEGRGVVVVVSPWNFPLAIPCGGVAAALAAGNTVILKPASDTVLPAALICECFWAGGVPREALQLLPCRGRDAGPALVNHALVDVVILTGGTETAESMLRQKPDLDLMAETGGKNATIVTALSDRDLAIKHVLHAAFSHSGQKCSATSLLLLEDEVYQDPIFRRALIDAARSLKVGSVWDKASKMGPLIRPPSDVLERGLKELEPGESWALMPEDAADNPGLWTPGVKWDVQPGSFTHMTELFGPVLAVMRFRRLDDAIGLVNATGFGLTSGLQSLDDREQAVWRQSIKAGNLYINRATTGAIVLRQPFGGMGKSAFGPGLKAGGPNYVVPLMRFEEKDDPTAIDRWLSVERAAAAQAEPELVDTLHRLSQGPDAEKLAAIVGSESMEAVRSRLERGLASYCYWARTEFTVEHDEQRLVGQDNFRRYLPIRQLHLRLMPGDRADDVILALFAARCVNCRIAISHAAGVQSQLATVCEQLTESWGGWVETMELSDQRLAEYLVDAAIDRLRVLSPGRLSHMIREAARISHVAIIERPVVADGRVELLWYLQEQSISFDYHRYGNLGARAHEHRAAVL